VLPATLREVAERAGVSPATVSFVLNGKRLNRVSEATRLSVLNAADSLGYRANTAARALRSRTTNALGITVAVDTNPPFYTELLLGAAAEAFACGQALILFPGDADVVAHAASELLAARRADGLILHGVTGFEEDQLASLADRAVVVQDRVLPVPANLTAVLLDNDAGRAAVMDHLLTLGHSSIAYLSPARHSGTRLASYTRALAEAGMPESAVIAYSGQSIDEAARAAERLLSLEPRPTAIVCANDVLAAGAYQMAAQLGLTIPRDLSVASFATFVIATALQPRLTAVVNPVQEAGRAAVRLLLSMRQRTQCESIVLPSPLAVRGSTAAPPSLEVWPTSPF
jgi:LacI family transcriptional regulator